ncbi:MAG TPA: mersacidin/lichenicidin family type 2 lantibiotic [Pirellulales bacterium]|jgi:mersacidin/lichenicidin family type 2 lantibiotic
MSRVDIIRAWKDASYRNSLSAAQKAGLPANPAGMVELTEIEASTINGKVALAGCSGCHGSRVCPNLA